MNWDYVAGWFDADGCVFIDWKKAPAIQFANTDRVVLEKIKECIDIPHPVKTTKRTGKQTRTYYCLFIGDHVNVKRILKELRHRCVTKKTKIEDALHEIAKKDADPSFKPRGPRTNKWVS